MDGDCQNNPKDIEKLLFFFLNDKGIKLVGGIRINRKDSYIKKISSKIANSIRAYILNDGCKDTGCSLKVFDKNIFLEFPFFNGLFFFTLKDNIESLTSYCKLEYESDYETCKTDPSTKDVATKVCNSIKNLHKAGWNHNDLHANNILVQKGGEVDGGDKPWIIDLERVSPRWYSSPKDGPPNPVYENFINLEPKEELDKLMSWSPQMAPFANLNTYNNDDGPRYEGKLMSSELVRFLCPDQAYAEKWEAHYPRTPEEKAGWNPPVIVKGREIKPPGYNFWSELGERLGHFGKRKSKRPNQTLINKAKKYKIRLMVKRGGKHVYKSPAVLRKQIIKKKRSLNVKRRSKYIYKLSTSSRSTDKKEKGGKLDKRKSKRPNQTLINKAKKYKIRLMVKRGGKRVYKSTAVLRKQIIKKKRSLNVKRKSKYIHKLSTSSRSTDKKEKGGKLDKKKKQET